MPSTIPILANGTASLTIIGGVKKNGISNERIQYPFYSVYQQDLNFIPGVVDTLDVEVEYRSNVDFVWLEDFEDGGISLEGSGSFTTNDSMYITSDASEVYAYDGSENKGSGKVELDTGFQIFENSSVQLFDLPRSGQEIYLEFNYKSETEFVAGIYPISGSVINGVPIVNFFSTKDEDGIAQWKKAYVSLKEDVNNAEYNGFDFKVFFNVQTNSDTEKHLVFLDNIKLIHFE